MAKKIEEKKDIEKKIVKKTPTKKTSNKKIDTTTKSKIKNDEATNDTEKVVIETKKEETVEEPKCKKKKAFIILIISLIVLGGMITLTYFNLVKKDEKIIKPIRNKKLPKLPKPELAEGERGQLGIDKNVNEKAIDKYLGRDDSVYRDMRMLEDPAEYESIGGNRYLNGYVKGFEVVPLPYIIPVKNLPKEVGYTYEGTTLFFQMSDGTYVPMYEESMKIVEELFPKDKIIFLMCGGGGYAGMMKQFLVSQGWDKDSIYVVGGYWYYEGKNDVKVPYETTKYGYTKYDFSNVPYHEIEFSDLTPIMPNRHNEGIITPFYLDDEYYKGKDEKFEELMKKLNNVYDEYSKTHKEYDSNEYNEFYNSYEQKVIDYINKLMSDKKTFVITVYNDIGCGDDDDTIRTKALKFFEKNHIYTYDIGFETLMKTDVYKDVRNAPNSIIVKNGKVYTFYYDESDADLEYNKSEEATAKWLSKYILLKDNE